MLLREHKQPSLQLVSASMPAPDLKIETFLRIGQGRARAAWQDPQSDMELAGVGVAADLKAWGDQRFAYIQEQARELFSTAWLDAGEDRWGEPCLLGGFAFRDDFLPDNTWSVFYPAHFILPHWQFQRVKNTSWITVNVMLPAEVDPRNEQAQLAEALRLKYGCLVEYQNAGKEEDRNLGEHLQSIGDLRYPMTYTDWAAMIESALIEMGRAKLQKVVLARMCEVRSEKPIDINRALSTLGERYATCYRFLFEPQPQHAFFGATPELLADVHGRELRSMALAGSIRRGHTLDEDARLEAKLLGSLKDSFEHGMVVHELRKRLSEICESVENPDQPGVLKFENIQHLHTPVHARLHTACGILPVVERLHPTPALGGVPREAALSFISQVEPKPRGWYAAPVGWINARMDGAFSVAIRSAVTQNERAWLYAGAGIVHGSDPKQEWDETELKFQPALQALGMAAERVAVQ